jgi:hypothetical protein
MFSGQLLLGGIAFLVLLITAGTLFALLVCLRQSKRHDLSARWKSP